MTDQIARPRARADKRSTQGRRLKQLRQEFAEEFADLKQTPSIQALVDQLATLNLEREELRERLAASEDVGSDLIRSTNAILRITGMLYAQRGQKKQQHNGITTPARPRRLADALWNDLNSFRYLSDEESIAFCRLSDKVDEVGSVEALKPEVRERMNELRQKALIRPPRPGDALWLDIDSRGLLTEAQRLELNELSGAADKVGALSKLEPDQLARIRALLTQVVRIKDEHRPHN